MASAPPPVISNSSNSNEGILIGDKVYSEVYLTIDNSLIPEERLSPTPSMLDGLDLHTETDLRILGCELIQSAGILLRLPQVAMATGQVLFHRFFYSKSFVKHSFEIPLPTRPHWYLLFGATEDEIKEICITTLKLYTRKKPNYELLEKEVEKRKVALQEAKLKAKGLNPDGTPALSNLGGFSPGSKPSSPREVKTDEKSPCVQNVKTIKKEPEERQKSSKSPHNGYNNRRSRSGTYSSRSRSRSHSRSITPRRHLNHASPHLKSKHRNDDLKSASRHGHKRKKSRSRSRSRSKSRDRSDSKKHKHERGHHRERRERSRSYDRTHKNKHHSSHSGHSRHRR
ncbi:CCNL1 protein, partial [Polypterus senegalus]